MALSSRTSGILELALADKPAADEIFAALAAATGEATPCPVNQILVGQSSGFTSAVAMSGDVGITASGATTIASRAITSSKLADDVQVGSLATLTTSVKTSAVAAINEVNAAAVKKVGTSVIDNLVTFSDVAGAVKDSSVSATLIPQIATAVNLSGSAPTSAQMEAAFGTRRFGSLSDSSDSTKSYFCFNDGASWFYVAGVKGV